MFKGRDASHGSQESESLSKYCVFVCYLWVIMCFCLACEWMNEWTNGHHCWWECQGFLTSTQTGRASPRLGSRRVGHDVPEVTFLKLCALYLDFHQKKKKKWVIVFPKSCDWNIMWWLTLSNLCCTVKYGNNVEQVDQICPVHCSSCKYTEVKVSVRMFTPLAVWMCGGLGRIQFSALLYCVPF